MVSADAAPDFLGRMFSRLKNPAVQLALVVLSLFADFAQLMDSTAAWLAGNSLGSIVASVIFWAVVGVACAWRVLLLVRRLIRRGGSGPAPHGAHPRRGLGWAVTILLVALVVGAWTGPKLFPNRARPVVIGVVPAASSSRDEAQLLRSVSESAAFQTQIGVKNTRVVVLATPRDSLLDSDDLRDLARRARVDATVLTLFRRVADDICLEGRVALARPFELELGGRRGLLAGMHVSEDHRASFCDSAPAWERAETVAKAESVLTITLIEFGAVLQLGAGNAREAARLASRIRVAADSAGGDAYDMNARVLAFALFLDSNLPELGRHTSAWVSRQPNSFHAWSWRRAYWDAMHSDVDEYAALGEMVRLMPNDCRVLEARARTGILLGRIEQAHTDALRMRDQLGCEKRATLLDAEVLDRLGEATRALAIFDEAIARTPEDASLYVARAGISWRQGNHGAALADLSSARLLASEDPSDILISRAKCYIALRRGNEARADLRAAMRSKRNRARAAYHLARLEMLLGRYGDAERVLTNGLKETSDRFWLYMLRSIARTEAGDATGASKDSAIAISEATRRAPPGGRVAMVRYARDVAGDTVFVTMARADHMTIERWTFDPPE